MSRPPIKGVEEVVNGRCVFCEKQLEKGRIFLCKECLKKERDRLSKAKTVFKEHEKWGKWVISEVRCPECLEYFDPEGFSKEEMNKCPNCGAIMREGEEEC